ncbi:gamma-glutamyltransferase [Nonomuraea typhae]|uniref:Gamma-glutamyltransferase n=1 Tax=Nonomuraea typhae TaxID=2603600 RepID=A0ABW7ZA68_9ACTN
MVLSRPFRPVAGDVAATGRKGMISTSHPAATQAGLAALRRGGSAVDAYLAAAAVQTVVEPVMTTLAGTMMISVFDPVTHRSHAIGHLGSIPEAEDGDLDAAARLSGRTVVAPGWVRAAHTAWTRWGRLPWAELFAEALAAARHGFVVDPLLWGWAFEYRTAAARYPEGREIWYPDGYMFSVGDVLRQPALARTIEQLAEQGPDYFYEGDFAKKYVETAQRHGGRLTLDDMAASQVTETPLEPLELLGGYELHTTGSLFALLLNLSALAATDDLYTRMRIIEEAWHHGLADVKEGFRVREPAEMADAVSPETAARLLPQVLNGKPRPYEAMNLGTNAIVVVDEDGVVAHGTHSATSTPFGVGLTVDGVIVPRPMFMCADPVVPIPDGWSTSLLAVRNGQPVFAASSPSISALQNIYQNADNVLYRGVSAAESVRRPLFGSAQYPSRMPMVESTFGEDAIAEVERRGLGITRVSPWEPEMGSCQAVHFGADGTLYGVADPRRLGRAAGY